MSHSLHQELAHSPLQLGARLGITGRIGSGNDIFIKFSFERLLQILAQEPLLTLKVVIASVNHGWSSGTIIHEKLILKSMYFQQSGYASGSQNCADKYTAGQPGLKSIESKFRGGQQCGGQPQKITLSAFISTRTYPIMPLWCSVADDERLTCRLDAVTELIVVRQLNDAMLFVGRAVLIQSITQRHEKTP